MGAQRADLPVPPTQAVSPSGSCWSRNWEQGVVSRGIHACCAISGHPWTPSCSAASTSAASCPPLLGPAGTACGPCLTSPHVELPTPIHTSHTHQPSPWILHRGIPPHSPGPPVAPLCPRGGQGRWAAASCAGLWGRGAAAWHCGHCGGQEATSSDWLLVQKAISAWHFSTAG